MRLREGAITPFPTSIDPSIPQCHVPQGRMDIQDIECNCTTATCGAGMLNMPGAVRAAQRPIAAVAVPVSVSPGQNVSLSAVGSAAACDRTIASYAWSIVAGANGTGIAGADRPVATVVAPASGAITVRLTVTDDAGRQDTADVTVTANAATTTAPASAGANACPGERRAAAPADRGDCFADRGDGVRQRQSSVHRRGGERHRRIGELAGQRRRGR